MIIFNTLFRSHAFYLFIEFQRGDKCFIRRKIHLKKNPKCLHFRYYIQLCRNIIQDIVWVVEQRKSNIYILLKPSIHNTVGAIGLRLRFSAAQSGQIWHSSSVETKNRSCLIKKILSEAPHLSSSYESYSIQYSASISEQCHCSIAVYII